MRIIERCSCGAEIDAQNDSYSSVVNFAEEWRANHRHEPRAGDHPTMPTMPPYDTRSTTALTTETTWPTHIGFAKPQGPDGRGIQ